MRAMKKRIEVWPDHDKAGRWCLRIQKSSGKFTLDEIREAAREYEWDFYLLVLDAFHDDEIQFTEMQAGDFATLYRTDIFYEEGEH